MPYDNSTHKYIPPQFEYYVLARDDDFIVNSVVVGNDPLYGYGSWDLFSGPFITIDDAYSSIVVDFPL